MSLLGKIGDIKKLRDQAVAIQKRLKEERIEIEEGDIRVVVTGDMTIEEFTVSGISSPQAISTLNKALKESQKRAAKVMQEVSGDLRGLLGQ